MNYERIYHSIINNRLNNPVLNEYTECHHILPRSLGGLNNKSNLVNLLAREHFICHLLLTKMYKEGSVEWVKMMKAFEYMYSHSTEQQRYSDNKWYEYLKTNFSKAQSIAQSGKNNSMYGTSWICNYKLNKTIKVKQDELQEYLDNGWIKGRIINTENYYSCKGCLYVKKDGIKKQIKQDELQEYLNNGWIWNNKNKQRKSREILIFNEITNEKIKITINLLQNYLNNGWIKYKDRKKYPSNRANQKLINNGIEHKFVFKDELQNYLDNGWKLGGIKGIKSGRPKNFRTKEHCEKLRESNLGKHNKNNT